MWVLQAVKTQRQRPLRQLRQHRQSSPLQPTITKPLHRGFFTPMQDLIETSHYDEANDALVVKTSYDSSQVMAENIMTKNMQPETGRYKGNLVKVATIHLGDVVRLKNLGYNILSHDPDEVKRALLYIQSEEKAHMLMPGTPIAKRKQSWA